MNTDNKLSENIVASIPSIQGKTGNNRLDLEPIAIIGIGCRLPGGADSPDALWELLCNGVDAISEVPPERYKVDAFYDSSRKKPFTSVSRWGGFVNQRIDEFDASFFGMSPREASCLDPLQRWLLEVSWEALEDGGQVPEELTGLPVGVFIGAFTLDYNVMQFNGLNRDLIEPYTSTGTAATILSARLSYFYDFTGPCFTVDTACSSSLVAIHLACQSLWNQESSMAMAGGVNAMFMPEYAISESRAGMLSPDGRCKSFDTQANGYVRGEGAAIVILKPLKLALKDGDQVYAVIRGTSCNHDGRSNGITVPNLQAQKRAMLDACNRSGIKPEQIQYVEAHGTGTPIGDPIEATAIGEVYGSGDSGNQKCLIGSIKTNIGHTEAVAGVVGLIKTALCLKYRQIPPSLHFHRPNPEIAFDDLGIEVVTSLRKWPIVEGPFRAGVNSFGFGGTNAHVIMDEPVDVAESNREESDGPYLLPISARNLPALQELTSAYHALLTSETSDQLGSLSDLCYTAALRRSHHPYRLLLIADSQTELIERLLEVVDDVESAIDLPDGELLQIGAGSVSSRTNLTFVFSGMGPQWWGMGQQLLEEVPLFREIVEKCDELFRKVAGWSLLTEMISPESTSRMTEYEVAQPANFVLQVGLAKIFESWGIQPDAVVGHSAGEVAAAYIAGILSLDEAITIIYHRSNLQQRTSGQGAVVAVGMAPTAMQKLVADVEDRISIAAINSPKSVTLVGNKEELEQIIAPLREEGVFCRYLKGNVPVHSHYMDPLQDDLREAFKGIKPRNGNLPFYSSVTGRIIDGEQLDADYWWRNVRQPVVFAKTIRELNRSRSRLFLELGPHPVLGGSILECLQEQESRGVVIATLRRHTDEREQLLAALAKLYTHGAEVNWRALFPDAGHHVRTPTYPWQREIHWQESGASVNYRLRGIIDQQSSGNNLNLSGAHLQVDEDVHPLLGNPVPGPHPTWELELDLRRLPYLADHRLQGTIAFPGAGYVEMAWGAAKEIFGEGVSSMTIKFRKALFFKEYEKPRLRISLDRQRATFQIYSHPTNEHEEWTLHATGKLGQLQKDTSSTQMVKLATVKERCFQEISVSDCYDRFRKVGLEYGSSFQGIGQLWQGTEEALARVKIPAAVTREMDEYTIHPAILDICFQVLAAALPVNSNQEQKNSTVYMPVSVREGRVSGQVGGGMWIHARVGKRSPTNLIGDISLCDDQGKVLVDIQGCKAVTLAGKNQFGLSDKPQDFYEVNWRPMIRQELQIQKPQNGAWVLFCDRLGVGDQLADILELNGKEVIKVYRGDEFIKLNDHEFSIDPTRSTDYQSLFSTINDGNVQPCRRVVHLWSIEITATEELDQASLADAETVGPISVMYLVQTLNKLGWAITPDLLWLVTRGAQYLTGDPPEMIAIGQAPVWGMARVIGHQEHHNIWGGIIDLDPLAPVMEVEALFDELNNPIGEDNIALRMNRAYVPRLEVSKSLAPSLPAHFHPDRTYLITGGLGSLGLVVARWLVENGARHLVLMGRSVLPDREEWGGLDPESAVGKKVMAVLELESMGATCHLAAVDVEDPKMLAEYLDAFKEAKRPPIRGVIHSAGVAHPKLMIHMDAAEFNRVQRPKTIGSWNLHQILRDESLDFFILFSSVASVVVSPGQSNYGAGNAFLDSLAHFRRAQGLPGLSINFGPWGEIGMATQFDDLNEYFTKRGMNPMTTAGGLNALARVFGQEVTQVMILSADWSMVKEMNYPVGVKSRLIAEVDSSPHLEGAVEEEGYSIHQSTDSGATTQAAELKEEQDIWENLEKEEESDQHAFLASYLLDMVAKILRLNKAKRDQMNIEQPLDSFGFDSMMAIELKNILDNALDMDLAVVDLLNGSSASQLSEKLILQRRFGNIPAGELGEKELSS